MEDHLQANLSSLGQQLGPTLDVDQHLADPGLRVFKAKQILGHSLTDFLRLARGTLGPFQTLAIFLPEQIAVLRIEGDQPSGLVQGGAIALEQKHRLFLTLVSRADQQRWHLNADHAGAVLLAEISHRHRLGVQVGARGERFSARTVNVTLGLYFEFVDRHCYAGLEDLVTPSLSQGNNLFSGRLANKFGQVVIGQVDWASRFQTDGLAQGCQSALDSGPRFLAALAYHIDQDAELVDSPSFGCRGAAPCF